MNIRKQLVMGCRWVARILGALLLLLTMVIAIGEGVPNPLTQPAMVQVGFLALALVLGGILAGWKWELAGGLISLFGWCLFVGAVVLPRGLNWFVAALALPGALYLASAWLRRGWRITKAIR